MIFQRTVSSNYSIPTVFHLQWMVRQLKPSTQGSASGCRDLYPQFLKSNRSIWNDTVIISFSIVAWLSSFPYSLKISVDYLFYRLAAAYAYRVTKATIAVKHAHLVSLVLVAIRRVNVQRETVVIQCLVLVLQIVLRVGGEINVISVRELPNL